MKVVKMIVGFVQSLFPPGRYVPKMDLLSDGPLFECQNCREEGRPWVVRLDIHGRCEQCNSEAFMPAEYSGETR
jgi:hypothetical protein